MISAMESASDISSSSTSGKVFASFAKTLPEIVPAVAYSFLIQLTAALNEKPESFAPAR
jgi:hypothetical protein